MDEGYLARVDALFAEALTLDAGDRGAFLDRRCWGEPALRADVDELLRLAFQPAPSLERGVVASGFLPDALASARVFETELEPGQRIGSWRVVREVGRGGMATVFLVERVEGQFEQRGALKLVRPMAGSKEIARRLQRERRILASLTHPGIARLLDGGQTEDGRPFFVMEFVEGFPIDCYCDDRRLTIADRLDLFLRVCEAVQHAHRQLVVHRDIKPSNIIVTSDGDVKLLDFGIAKLLSPGEKRDDDITSPVIRILTPEYASPEQVRNEPVAIASDVYQLGLLLYELLTGHRAQVVVDATTGALERAVCDTPPVRPSIRAAAASGAVAGARRMMPRALVRALKGDLDTIVLCTLRKEPDRRYASVGELLADIRRYRTGLPVHSRHDEWSYRAGKFIGRHRIALGWATAVLVAASVAFPAWLDQRSRAASQAARAEQIERLIGDLFAFPNPRVRPQPPAARTYIDHAANLVRAELQDQPASQGRLLTLLGRLYNALGLYGPSIDVLEQALRLRREISGADSAEVAETLEWLGQSQHYSGRYDEATASVRDSLAIRRLHRGPDDPDTIRTAIELGDLLHTRGEIVEAERTLREVVGTLRSRALTLRTEELGHDSFPRAIRDLASVLRDRGLLDESAALYREAIDVFRTLHGEPNQQVATSQVYFAHLLIMRSEFEQAEAMLNDSIPTLRRIYDGDHALVGIGLRTFGHLRIAQGRLREAEALLEAAQRVQRQWLGADHPMVARAMAHEAELALQRGHPRDAAALASRTQEAFDRLRMTDHPSAIEARRTLGEALLALGDRDAAARELTACLASAERQFVVGDERVARIREVLAGAR
jgi:eukaryotic-like serine/threonine-protein kinase